MSDIGEGSLLDIGMEIRDPALWAAIQLIRPLDQPPKTQGEAIDVIRGVFERAMVRSDEIRGVSKLRQAVCDLRELCQVVARGDGREDRISKALVANKIAESVDCLKMVATQ